MGQTANQTIDQRLQAEWLLLDSIGCEVSGFTKIPDGGFLLWLRTKDEDGLERVDIAVRVASPADILYSSDAADKIVMERIEDGGTWAEPVVEEVATES
jgi:hypothetical protein